MVVYNACFGGFSLPLSILQEVFRRCPPNTEEGRKIFWARKTIELDESTHTFFGPYVLYSSGAYVLDLNTLEVFSLRSFNREALRTNPSFHEIVEEYIGKPLNDQCLLQIAEVPFGCSYKIVEEDGKEQVVVEVPWKKVIADLIMIVKGVERLSLNPLTQALLADETDELFAKKVLE